MLITNFFPLSRQAFWNRDLFRKLLFILSRVDFRPLANRNKSLCLTRVSKEDLHFEDQSREERFFGEESPRALLLLHYTNFFKLLLLLKIWSFDFFSCVTFKLGPPYSAVLDRPYYQRETSCIYWFLIRYFKHPIWHSVTFRLYIRYSGKRWLGSTLFNKVFTHDVLHMHIFFAGKIQLWSFHYT